VTALYRLTLLTSLWTAPAFSNRRYQLKCPIHSQPPGLHPVLAAVHIGLTLSRSTMSHPPVSMAKRFPKASGRLLHPQPFLESANFAFVLHKNTMHNFGVIRVAARPAIWSEIVQHQKIIHSLKNIHRRQE
jgi:hypothetical protein